MAETLGREYFEGIYSASEDPWNFAGSEYEADKYRETLSGLARSTYRRALEIGCSIGVQTAMLAGRCDRLLALDVSEQAIERARSRCAHLDNVEFAVAEIPKEYPAGCFDLTILSEVGYYFALADLATLADRIAAHSQAGAHLLLVHWLPFVPEYPITGDQVHEYFLGRQDWQWLTGCKRERYRIDLFAKLG